MHILGDGGREEKKLEKGELPIVTNTSLMLLRLCGKYLHLLQALEPISTEVFACMTNLLDFYTLTVFDIFTQDLVSYVLQCAGAGFNPQHFYHQGDPVFQVWHCYKNHPQCLFSSPTVTPPMLIFQKLESTK